MKRLAAALAASALAWPSVAQTPAAQDWELNLEPASGALLAVTRYDSGLTIAFRCRDGDFAAVIAGLPASGSPRRNLTLAFRGEAATPSAWTTTDDPTVVVGDYPAPLARQFRQGGALRLTVPGAAADGRNLTYAVDLPPSAAAIDRVLTRCERPLTDPRDALLTAVEDSGLSGGVTWARAPSVSFPSRGRYASGFAVVTCLAWPDGRLRDCVVESEHPHDGGFGRQAVRAAEQARVRLPDGADGPRQVGFYTRFRMPDSDDRG